MGEPEKDGIGEKKGGGTTAIMNRETEEKKKKGHGTTWPVPFQRQPEKKGKPGEKKKKLIKNFSD